jgi:predicted transcriptional regulator
VTMGSGENPDHMPAKHDRERNIRTAPFLWVHRAVMAAIQAKIPAAQRANAVAVYTVLAHYTRETKVTIEIRTIQEFLGFSETTAKRTLRLLVEKKLIRKRLRYGKVSGKRVCLANEYLLVNVPAEQDSSHPPRKAR